MYVKIWSKSFTIFLSKLTSIHLYLVKHLIEELLTCNLYMREHLSWNTTLYVISYPGITQFSLYASTVFPNISSALSKNSFQSLSSSCHRVQSRTSILCMGCHPHTRVNPAQRTIKETQEPMWLQTIYKILFQHNKEASNTRRENEEWEWERVKSRMPLIQ